ncbi:FtsX-like permease family protein [Glycomyces sp. NPDC048151]|uniref:FtsX-like permease family protein n=1 Tax=Glycomyces sp. NPDC048151 TaxID=3364002 RepID=UPI0037108D43
MLASHRLAFRIARREALRYKGRSALSITLLGLPLLGVAIGATAYDTSVLDEEETAEQYLGSNDAYIEVVLPGIPIEQMNWDSQWISYDVPGDQGFDEIPETPVGEADILAALPAGSSLAPYSHQSNVGASLQAESADGLAQLRGYGYDLGNGLYTAAGLEYLEGDAPQEGETVVNEAAADLLGIGVGDDLVLDGGETMPVSGVVEIPWNLNEPLAIATSFESETYGWLLDTPDTLTIDQALALNEMGVTVWAGSLLDQPGSSGYVESSMAADSAELMIYGLIVVAVVMEVVLLAGPAFAISARRRTREFALMSANGATPAQVRRVVLAGGVLFGLIAAFVAIAIGVGLVAAAMPWLEQLIGHRSAGLRVMPAMQASLVGVAIATGLLSALAAAISASRVNVIAALMGRTPMHGNSKRWMITGLAMVAAGIAAGIGGVALWSLPLMATAIVLAQLGLVTCTPALLALTAKLGRWLPLAPRLALREAGRNRGSAAPAIAAVLGVVAGGMAFSMIVTAESVRYSQELDRELPQGTMTLSIVNNGGSDAAADLDWDAALAEVEPQLDSRLNDLELTYVPEYSGWGGCGDVTPQEGQDVDCTWAAVRPEENQCSYWSADTSTDEATEAAIEAARKDPRCDEAVDPQWAYTGDLAGSTDPEVVAAYTDLEGAELDKAVAVLEQGGVIVADPWAVTDAGTVSLEQQITIWDEEGGSSETQDTLLELPAVAVEKGQLGVNGMLIGPGAAEAMGLEHSPWHRLYLVSSSTEPEAADVEALSAALNREIADGDAFATFEVVDYTDPFMTYFVIGVTGLCALIALGATAVSTGLIVAEQRRDMSTLGAIGAAPSLRKRFAMWQTVVIAVFGTGLGTLAGFIGYALIRETLNRPLQLQYPFPSLYGWELPWASFAIMLLAVPLTAAIGAVLFTKATLPSERRIA